MTFSRLFRLVVLDAVLLSVSASQAVSQHPDQGSLQKESNAELEKKLMLLAQWHVEPLLNKHGHVPCLKGAWFDISDPHRIRFHSSDGVETVETAAKYVRALTLTGRWTHVDAVPTDRLKLMLVKTDNMLFVIRLRKGTISPVPLAPVKKGEPHPFGISPSAGRP